MEVWKMIFFFHWVDFRVHVNFPSARPWPDFIGTFPKWSGQILKDAAINPNPALQNPSGGETHYKSIRHFLGAIAITSHQLEFSYIQREEITQILSYELISNKG